MEMEVGAATGVSYGEKNPLRGTAQLPKAEFRTASLQRADVPCSIVDRRCRRCCR